eukprot:14224179-Heterocapsa_arctica.AAC.1
MCSEFAQQKGSELKEEDPGRKWKGRYVFRGNQVTYEHASCYLQWVIFHSSHARSVEGCRRVRANAR